MSSLISLAKSKVVFIAEIGSNFDGSLDRALYLIDLAKSSGANVVKFQHYTAETLVSKDSFVALGGEHSSHQKDWKDSVFSTYQKAQFSMDWTSKVADYCNQNNIIFMTSPYSLDLVDAVDKYSLAFKIGSGDITFKNIIKHIDSKHKPVLLATGASTSSEVEKAMSWLSDHERVVLMQCNTNYSTTELNKRFQNLNVLTSWQEKFPRALLGLSCHLKNDTSVIAAVALGARIIEKHFTDDETRQGPDHSFAMNPSSFGEMVQKVRDLEQMLGDGIKKVEPNETDTRIIQRRSMHSLKYLKRGTILSAADFVALRPAPSDSISPDLIHSVEGCMLQADIDQGSMLKWSDILL